MVMIKVFKATDTNFNTNGEVTLKPTEAIITKTIEEEYIEVECPLKYADFLVQDNILLVDTLTGKKAYKIHNPIVGYNIAVKAWLIWQENPPIPTDRGATIAHGKNLKDLECQEDWDDVVTKLIPIGYKEVTLPEGYLSIQSPYQRVYEKTIEFDLSESLEAEVEALEEELETKEAIVAGLENSIAVLTGKIHAYETTKTSLEQERAALQQRLSELGNSEAERREKAVIETQIPLINKELTDLEAEKVNTEAALAQAQVDLEAAQDEHETSKAEYEEVIISDLRKQAQKYLDINKYPRINYSLEAHLKGVYEIGDTVRVKHPDMRIDLLTKVTAYEFDALNMKFRKIEFGTLKTSLREELDKIEEKVEETNETVKKYGSTITKYRSEFKRNNEELVSKFMSEVYGVQNGLYGLLQKNQSLFRQTASEISATVSRVNADLSEDIAALSIRADQIQSTVQSNFTTLNGKITTNESKITQTATQIRSEVSTAINGVNQSISIVEQTANKINWLVKSGTSASNFTLTDRAINLVANNINLDGYVKFTNLSAEGQTTINAGNITTGTIDADRVNVTNLNINNVKYGSYPVIDCTGSYTSPDIYIGRGGSGTFIVPSSVTIRGSTINVGHNSTSLYRLNLVSGNISLTSSKLGFYGSSPINKPSVNKVYTASISTAMLADRFNTLLTSLNDLGLINASRTS